MAEEQGALTSPVRFWFHVGASLGVIAIIAGLMASWVGVFVAALANAVDPPIQHARIATVGSLLGFCVIALLLVGALTITVELLGLGRPYDRRAEHRQTAQRLHHKALLVTVAVLAWGALLSLFTLAGLFSPG